MNYKSYLIEKDYSKLRDNKSILFYGENTGLKNYFKQLIKNNNNETSFINFSQDEILNNENILRRELDNSSLFEVNKIIFLERCNDKILKVLEEYFDLGFNFQTIIFADILEKKSKLRSVYEKSKTYASIACFPDSQITIQKIIFDKLKDFQGLTQININLIIESSNLDRVKLENEIEKITVYFLDKKIKTEKLIKLLNNSTNDDFNELKDEAIKGNRIKTNQLLNNTIIEPDKGVYYLALLNQRFIKLEEINSIKDNVSIEETINKIKPPVFWKDKPNLINQIKKWKTKNIKEALRNIYNLELKIKSNSSINNNILIRKLIIDLCNLANA